MMIESEKRRPEFVDEPNSVDVVFADGQQWWVPKPWLVIRPQFGPNGVPNSAYRFLTYSDKLDALVEAIGAADDADLQVMGAATLAAYLLRFNYDLSEGELDQLLAFRVGDPVSAKWMEDVVAIATGQSGPKVFRAGVA